MLKILFVSLGWRRREVVEAVIDGTTHVTYKQADGLINLKDLKRLVASLDLIKHMGGISEVKRKFRDNGSCHGERMKSLIADHDSIFLICDLPTPCYLVHKLVQCFSSRHKLMTWATIAI